LPITGAVERADRRSSRWALPAHPRRGSDVPRTRRTTDVTRRVRRGPDAGELARPVGRAAARKPAG